MKIDINEIQNKFEDFLSGKKSRSMVFILVAIIICIGYIIFFTSSIWMPVKSDIVFSSIGQEQELSLDRTVTLERWDYDEKQNMMEIELSFLNSTFDGNNDYSIEAVIIKNNGSKKTVPWNAAVSSDTMCVLQISDIPKSNITVSLKINCVNVQDTKTVKFYSDKVHSYKTNILLNQNETYYRMLKLERKAEDYEKSISELQKQYQNNIGTINTIKNTINTLEAEKEYQTTDEIDITNDTIAEYNNSIKEKNEENDEILKQIYSYREKLSDIHKISKGD